MDINHVIAQFMPHFTHNWTINKPTQDLLRLRYRELIQEHKPLPAFGETGFRVFSQNDEDGLLHFIFSVIGETSKTAVEFCCGNGIECNTANLIINHGWTALLADGEERRLAQGREFYARCRDTFVYPPKLVRTWITGETVNDLLVEHDFIGEIDLLTIDLDGVDWWIWKAIDVAKPRVVVVEYQDIWGPDTAVTVPYRPDFQAQWDEGVVNYGGASLAAFVKLGQQKGYRLVGCNRYGFNAFFVRNDLAPDLLPEVPASACFTHPKTAEGMRHRLPKALMHEWVRV